MDDSTEKLLWDLFKVGYYSFGEHGRRGIPLMLVGPPGEGKTAIPRLFAKHIGVLMGAWEGSRLEPQDVAGLANFSEDGRSFEFRPPKLLRDLADAGDGILFTDEWTRASAPVQASLLNLTLDGRTEGIDLPPGIARWAACNPAAMVGGVDMDPANAARFTWVEFPLQTAAEFRDYLMDADERTGEGRVPEGYKPEVMALALERNWDREMGVARSYIASFLSRNPSCLREKPPTEARAWSNPRTWAMAARNLAACSVHGLDWSRKLLLLNGAVGQANGNTFVTWLRNMDLPDPTALLDDEKARKSYDIRSDTKTDRVWTVLDATLAILQTTEGRALDAGASGDERALLGPRTRSWVELLQGVSQRKDVRDVAAAMVARAVKLKTLYRNEVFMREMVKLSEFVSVISAFQKT